MTDYVTRQPVSPALPQTRRPRGQASDIKQFQWHATRGTARLDAQVQATENWFANPKNLEVGKGEWGGSADFVLGPDWRANGEIVIVQFGHWWETFSSWSAGYGATADTWPAAPFGVAIEVAQSVALEPYSEETIDACVWLCRHVNEGLRTLGVAEIPPVILGRWEQNGWRDVPAGHIGHDQLANGWKLGKSDPGPLFPYEEICRRLREADAPPPPPMLTYEDGKRERDEAWARGLEEFVRGMRSQEG